MQLSVLSKLFGAMKKKLWCHHCIRVLRMCLVEMITNYGDYIDLFLFFSGMDIEYREVYQKIFNIDDMSRRTTKID
jgi:hypothetical protein